MSSSDPWFDWWVDYGSFDGFGNVPPELAALDSPNGIAANSWRDQEGNVVLPPLLPPLPPSAPACARQAYQDWVQLIGNLYLDAIRNCDENALAFGFNRLGNYDGPPFLLHDVVFASVSFGIPYWNDPCSSASLGYPSNCDYFLDFFSGFFRSGCPEDYRPTTLFSPAVHRLISEVVRPTGRAFLWRLAYDQPVFWPLTFNPEVLRENNLCKSWALAILLQIEAMQDLLNQVQTSVAYLQFQPYFDGVLLGRRYTVTDELGNLVGTGFIGYNRTLELGFCLNEKIFRGDVGRVACDEGEDDMAGCSCNEVRQIVREELDLIRNEYLDPINDNSRWVRNLFEPLEDAISQFFAADGENAWTRFLSRFSFLSAFLRPSNTDPDEIIAPPLPDRIAEAFDRTRIRQRAILSNVAGIVRVLVKFSGIQGERNTSRDTWIPPTSIRPYNHYGQVWVEYGIGSTIRRSAWQWIRSRDSEHIFLIPDIRNSQSDNLVVSARYQLFAGLNTTPPQVQVLLPELLESNYWNE
jgi:hypothetical protein